MCLICLLIMWNYGHEKRYLKSYIFVNYHLSIFCLKYEIRYERLSVFKVDTVTQAFKEPHRGWLVTQGIQVSAKLHGQN